MNTARIILFFQLAARLVAVEPAPLVEIRLPKPYDSPAMEYSGLAWFQDHLILLPQYPNGYLLAIPRAELETRIAADTSAEVAPIRVVFNDGGTAEMIPGFEGYEAIAFQDSMVFLTLEARLGDRMSAYCIQGSIQSIASGIFLDPTSAIMLEPPVQIPNMAYESLVLFKEDLIPLFEANGARINPDPVQPLISTDWAIVDTLPFPAIEYRITDATAVDSLNCFWVSNYLWPGEYFTLKPAPDGFVNPAGTVDAHTGLERLLELEILDNRIYLKDTPPIWLSRTGKEGRNWEGLARFDNRGFILVTDEFPRSILAFLPWVQAPPNPQP